MIAWVYEAHGHWRGTTSNAHVVAVISLADDHRCMFVCQLLVEGYRVHASEHACLCEAKTAIEEAVARAKALRATETSGVSKGGEDG